MADDAREQAAEQVREHLVTLRGGAPFLSAKDGRLLGRWLDDATPVAAICLALEREVEQRRKAPNSAPLSLTHAKRHLGRVAPATPAPAPTADATHPFAPLAVALRAHPDPDARDLATRLEAIAPDPRDGLLEEAIAAIRAFHAHRWASLDEEERKQRVAAATLRLGDLARHLDEATLLEAAEAHARDDHRQELPWLSTSTLWQLAHGGTS